MIAMTATPIVAHAPATAEYRLAVRGKAGEAIRLRAVSVPSGWMVSFCTGRLCEPYAFRDELPKGGVTTVDVRVFPLEHQRGRTPSFAIDGGATRVFVTGR